MTDAVIKASLHSYRSLASKKQLNITLEVPGEFADAALRILGVNDPSGTQWFALARLQSPVAEPLPSGAPAPAIPKLRSNLAAIKCKEDKEFQQWLWAQGIKAGLPSRKTMAPLTDAEHSDMVLKELLGITSKKELDVPGPAQDAFDKLMTDYDMRNYTR